MFSTKSTDSELWHAVTTDNQSAFNMLFDRYWISLYKTAHYYLNDPDICSEVVNDVFVSIWKRRNELEIISFFTFMQTSVRYQIYKHRRAVKLKIVFQEEVIADELNELNHGETRILLNELNQELYVHLNQLPKRCQEIFELSRFDHLSNNDIAVRLNISKRTVENQLALALKHLRICFKNIISIMLFIV